MTHDGLEERLRAVIAEVTGRDPGALPPELELGAALGLDSLTALRVLARVEQRLGVRFPDAELGRLRSLRALAEAVRAAGGAGPDRNGPDRREEVSP